MGVRRPRAYLQAARREIDRKDRSVTDLETRLFREIAAIRAIDCHSHVPPESPHARGLADLLG